MTQDKLRVVPCAIDRANRFVAFLHRHHQPTSGGRFALAVVDPCGEVRGVAIVGTPVARMLALDGLVLEVLRVCTDGTPNAPSALYGAVARTARAMGASRVVTYTRKDEPGTSLRAAGWNHEADTGQRSWAVERGCGRTDKTERWAVLCQPPALRPRMARASPPLDGLPADAPLRPINPTDKSMTIPSTQTRGV